MTSRLEKYERRLASAREFERMKKYLSLFGIGLALWINDLWDLALVALKEYEGRFIYWVYHIFKDSKPKISPVLEYLNWASFILFLAFTAWLVYWAYMDTYVRKAQGKVTWSFRKKLLIGVIVNTVTYGILWVPTYYVLYMRN